MIGGWEHYWEIKMASAVYGTDMASFFISILLEFLCTMLLNSINNFSIIVYSCLLALLDFLFILYNASFVVPHFGVILPAFLHFISLSLIYHNY